MVLLLAMPYAASWSFKINYKEQYHLNDNTSIEIGVNQMRYKGQTPFCFFKQQGAVHPRENGTLQKEDLMLVIATPLQKQLLQKLGHDKIGINSVHDTTGSPA